MCGDGGRCLYYGCAHCGYTKGMSDGPDAIYVTHTCLCGESIAQVCSVECTQAWLRENDDDCADCPGPVNETLLRKH
jgi:hypothetical protein